MTQWPLQRNAYALTPMSKTSESTHVLTIHNTNTPSRVPSAASSNAYDDSLTNLSWLHDINILKRTIPTINTPAGANKRKEPASSNDADDTQQQEVDDDQWRMYRSHPQAKPVYSYCQLILLAMRHSGFEKMTLSMIYDWIAEHFPYFKKLEPTWQHSIRLNLLSNRCFVKVSRNKKEGGGKGGFYKVSPDYQRQSSQQQPSLSVHPQEQQLHPPPVKRVRSTKRPTHPTGQSDNGVTSDAWIDPILPCHGGPSYVRMPSSFLSPISSPNSLTVPSFHPQQQIHDPSSQLSPSSSSSPPSSATAKQNFMSTKLDEADMLLLDAVTFDWDAYLCETPNDIELSSKTEQDLFNDFNAALTDLTYSAEVAAAGGDSSAFDAFEYPTKPSTFTSLFDDEEQSIKVKGRGIKRPLWWLTSDHCTSTKLPSLETAFDLKLPK